MGCRDESGTQGRAGQEWLQAPPEMPWAGVFWPETPSPGPFYPGSQPQARAAAHRPGGGGLNPIPWPRGPALLTSDLQVGEGLHRNGDAERQQRESSDQAIPGQVLPQGYRDSQHAPWSSKSLQGAWVLSVNISIRWRMRTWEGKDSSEEAQR